MVNDKEPAPLKAECATLNIVEAKEYQIVQQPTFALQGGLQFKSGAWVSVFIVDRCGQKARRRLLIRYIPEQNRLEPIELLPGDFFGNLRLEVDAIKIVLPGIMANGMCSDQAQAYILDVHSLGPPMNGRWSEVWKAQVCGNIVNHRVDYVQDNSGTTITGGPFTPP
jgi:hypothetical protein